MVLSQPSYWKKQKNAIKKNAAAALFQSSTLSLANLGKNRRRNFILIIGTQTARPDFFQAFVHTAFHFFPA
jgi:hypothetical protein